MKYLKFLFVGILFGVIMTKSEAISWYRIQEMFLFDSFHMFGMIGTAVISGIIITQLIKQKNIKSIEGETIIFKDKNQSIPRYLLGGIIFSFGWAMTGACPGPLFTLLGHGIEAVLVIIVSAVLGTLVYGILRPKLPH